MGGGGGAWGRLERAAMWPPVLCSSVCLWRLHSQSERGTCSLTREAGRVQLTRQETGIREGMAHPVPASLSWSFLIGTLDPPTCSKSRFYLGRSFSESVSLPLKGGDTHLPGRNNLGQCHPHTQGCPVFSSNKLTPDRLAPALDLCGSQSCLHIFIP